MRRRDSRVLKTLALPAGALLALSFGLAACGGSSSSSSSSAAAPETSSAPAPAPTTEEPPAPNPNPEGDCSQEALNSAASNATSGAFGGVEEFDCAGGWAVVKGKMNDQYLPLLFKAEDGSWVPQEIQEICQAGQLPQQIADEACD